MTLTLPAGVRGLDGRHRIDAIVPSVAAAVGAREVSDVNLLGLPEASSYVVFLVDGMGLSALQQHRELAPFLSSMTSVDDVVCGIPSTTATSLTSLGTGARPGAHGVAGYTTRVPETGGRLNMLKWDQSVEADVWQPLPTVWQRIAEAGIPAATVNQAKFADSGLTLCSQRGVPFHGIESIYERHEVILDVVEAASATVTYAYESRLDFTGHSKGVASQEWREMLSSIDSDLAALRRDLPGDCVLLVTADHGMIDLPADGRFDVDAAPWLLQDVTMVAGEARFRHLYTRAGAADDVAGLWRAEMGDRAVVITRDEAETADWFGPITADVRGRLGDVMVAALDDFAVFSSREFAIEFMMTGFHGSITEDELRIPVLVA